VSERIVVRRITPPFIIICVLVLTVAGIYGYSHHRVAETMPAGPPLQSANLVMQDHDDGSISVFNAAGWCGSGGAKARARPLSRFISPAGRMGG
jgi:hypothetical protein